MTMKYNTVRVPTESEIEEAMARARKIRAEAFSQTLSAGWRFLFGKSAKAGATEKPATHWSSVRPWGPTPSV